MSDTKIIRFNTFLNLFKKQKEKIFVSKTEFRIYKRQVYLFVTIRKLGKKVCPGGYITHYYYYRVIVPQWLQEAIKSFKDETLTNNARDMKEAFNKFLNYGSRK